VGGEFVSSILTAASDDKQWFNPVGSIVRFLSDRGEQASPVTGIHVHAKFLDYKHAQVDVLEAAIYRITSAEMTYQRGSKHLQYCHYRPLVPKQGPAVIIDSNGNMRPCFDIEKLMKAKTPDEFFMALGRADINPNSRHPAKYHGLNFNSILSKGTVELRTGNFTQHPRFVYAWVRVFQRMLALAFSALANPLELHMYEDLPLGYNGDFHVNQLINMLGIKDTEVIDTLHELWSLTSWPEPLVGYQRTHLGHGLGRNMPQNIINFTGVRTELVPDILTDVKVWNAEDFIGDSRITAIRSNVPMQRERPAPTVQETPSPRSANDARIFEALSTGRISGSNVTLRGAWDVTTINSSTMEGGT
jgi:hypothetical protein